jgi:predicted  nucleic acid-binding Zn-ribbon protein
LAFDNDARYRLDVAQKEQSGVYSQEVAEHLTNNSQDLAVVETQLNDDMSNAAKAVVNKTGLATLDVIQIH